MIRNLLFALLAVFSISAQAQAPDFSVMDLDGNEINLYADILDQGLIAVVDVSATWCPPCWSLHSSKALEDLHQAHGPNGSNQLRVIFYEGDASTGMADLEGTTGSTMGDWLTGTNYPVVDENPLTLNLGVWAPLGFPTVNVIDPSDKSIVADTWNILTYEGQKSAIEAATGITLTEGQPSGIEDLEEVSMNVYPNPATDRVNLQLEEFNGQYTVQVFNALGMEVLNTTAVNATQTLDISTLSTGQYMVRVFNNEKESVERLNIIK